MTWLVCLKKIAVFFLLLRNNGAATGTWPLITLAVNLIVDQALTGEREMCRRSQYVVSLNGTKFHLCLSLRLLVLCGALVHIFSTKQQNCFCKDLFLLAESLELSLPISKFQLSSTRFCFRGKLYFYRAAK